MYARDGSNRRGKPLMTQGGSRRPLGLILRKRAEYPLTPPGSRAVSPVVSHPILGIECIRVRVPSLDVYPVPLDPSNLPALDLRVVKWQVATPSHVRPSRIPEKVDTYKPRLLRRVHACPDEIKFGCAQQHKQEPWYN
ncbi:hypothetical protein CRG98_009156 [Punica granatum]|uniref:Uncharacterized protein n=1 Tax=Punica granatum TaxID=22663 RepID=A0A2I0KRI6_PUNGR|nr:hypothetical protein CRG98_009156 [Punica granatum]